MIIFSKIYTKLSNSDIGRRMATGAIWSFTGTAAAKVIVLISSIICAHFLTQTQYGEFGIVRSTISMFVIFGEAGLGLTATKYISEYKATHKSRIPSIYYITTYFAIITGVIVTTIVLILSGYISSNLLNAPHLKTSIMLGSIMLFLAIQNGAQIGVLSGFEDFKDIAKNTFCGSLFESVFMLIGAYYYDVVGAVLGYGLGFIVLYLLNQNSINRTFKNNNIIKSRNQIFRGDYKLLYTFSIPAALSSFLVAPTYWILKTMLANSSGFEEVALFEAADQWRIIILFIPSAISQIVLPILSSFVKTNNERFWKVLLWNVFLNAGITAVIAIVIILFSKSIMGIYGNSYNDNLILVYLAISAIFSSIANVVGLSISSRAKMWEGFAFNMLWASIILGLGYIFIQNEWGAQGIALAITFSYIVHTLLQLFYLYYIKRHQNV